LQRAISNSKFAILGTKHSLAVKKYLHNFVELSNTSAYVFVRNLVDFDLVRDRRNIVLKIPINSATLNVLD
jgi:hypothetical protein